MTLEKWSLKTGGLLTQVWLPKALVTSKENARYCCAKLSIVFMKKQTNKKQQQQKKKKKHTHTQNTHTHTHTHTHREMF